LPAKRASAGHCGSRPRPQACYGRLGSIGYSFVRASPGLAHASPSGNSQANRSVRLGPLGGALMARPNCPDFPSAGIVTIVTHGRVPGGDMMLKGTGRTWDAPSRRARPPARAASPSRSISRVFGRRAPIQARNSSRDRTFSSVPAGCQPSQ
jgi:hypothetical protein